MAAMRKRERRGIRKNMAKALGRLMRILGRKRRGNGCRKLTDEEIISMAENAMLNKKLYLRCNLSVDILAAEAGTNRTYIKRALKSREITLSNYVNSFRMKVAMDLICADRNRLLPLGEIAERSGFGSDRVMNYYVLRMTGLSARNFRARILSMDQEKNFSTSGRASGNANTATRS